MYVRSGQIVKQDAGILTMGPMYPWYPVLGTFRSGGIRPGLAAAFLYSRAIRIPMRFGALVAAMIAG